MLARLALCAALAAGCAGSFCGARVYKPLVISSRATGPMLLAAAQRAARELGASAVDVAREEQRTPASGSRPIAFAMITRIRARRAWPSGS